MNRNTFIGIVIAVSGLLISSSIHAQNASGKQFYVESGGPEILFGMNFDNRFKSGERLGFGYRVGIGLVNQGDEPTCFSIPVGVNYVFGKNNSSDAFEAGFGFALLTADASSGQAFSYLSFMYRKAPIDGGFTWRIGCTPIFTFSGSWMLLPTVGIGYAF